MKINFELFNNATVKKEYLKDGIKYIELTHYDEESNKLYVFNMSYKRYLLQKYLGYLIPSNHKIISLDGNEENFDIFNLGIRDEYNESPVYKGWKKSEVFIHSYKRNDLLINLSKSQKYIQMSYHFYLMSIHLGRRLLKEEKVYFKNKIKKLALIIYI